MRTRRPAQLRGMRRVSMEISKDADGQTGSTNFLGVQNHRVPRAAQSDVF